MFSFLKTKGNHQVWHIVPRFNQAITYKSASKAPTVRAVPARFVTVVVLGMTAAVHYYDAAYISKYICGLCYTIHRAIIGVSLTSLVDCIDAILLNNPEDSLTSLKHQRRGTGPRTRIRDGHTQIRKHDLNSGFLKNEAHKKELLSFLCEHIDKKRLGGKLLLRTKCAYTRVLAFQLCCTRLETIVNIIRK